MPTLAGMGFEKTNLEAMKLPTGISGGAQLYQEFLERIDLYDETRNFPAVKGPSYLGVHLRFGTVSIRELAAEGLKRQDSGSAGAPKSVPDRSDAPPEPSRRRGSGPAGPQGAPPWRGRSRGGGGGGGGGSGGERERERKGWTWGGEGEGGGREVRRG